MNKKLKSGFKTRNRRPRLERLEDRRVLTSEWTNPADNLDVNGDYRVSALDALQVINELNIRKGNGTLAEPYPGSGPRVDVNRSGNVSAVDALQVINALNNGSGERMLADTDQFFIERSTLITLGQDVGSRMFRIDLDAQFGSENQAASLQRDTFAVYLVDINDDSRSLIGDPSARLPVFSLAGQEPRTVAGISRWDGRFLDLDLSTVSGVETGRLVLQSINRNAESEALFDFNLLSNTVDTEDFTEADPLPVFGSALAPVGPDTDLTELQENASAEVIERNSSYNSATGVFTTELAVRAASSSVGKRVAVAFPNLPVGVSLINASGLSADQVPYVNFTEATPRNGLGRSQQSKFIRVEFDNPLGVFIEFDPLVLTTQPNRPPELNPIAPIIATPGQVLRIPIQATDPDGDIVTVAIGNSDAMPTSRVTANNELVLRPTLSQLGNSTIIVTASDGTAFVRREVNIEVVPDSITTTRISGQVLDVDQTPIEGLLLELAGTTAVTDDQGRFVVNVGQGPIVSDTLRVRGDLFDGGASYPFIAEELPLMLGRTPITGINNQIDRPIYLPKIGEGTLIDPTSMTTVTTPLIEGAAVQVAPGTLMTRQGVPFDGELSITEVPAAFTPVGLPDGMGTDMIVTIQPGGMSFMAPTALTLPNRAGWPAGSEMDLWSVSPVTGEFEIVGTGQVSADGSVIETIDEGIRFSSWSGFFPPPPRFPLPEDPDGEIKPPDSPQNSDPGCNANPLTPCLTSTVDMFTGALVENHQLVSYQSQGVSRGLAFVYDSLRADPRPIIHGGLNDAAAGTEIVTRIDLRRGELEYQVPGYVPDGPASLTQDFSDLRGGEHFFISPDEVGPADFGVQVDMTTFVSGRYDYTIQTGRTQRWEQSVCTTIISVDASGNRTCDTVPELVDRISFSTASQDGELIVVNESDSPYGSGWGIAGLLELVENPDGTVLLINGNGNEQLFEPPATPGSPYVNPAGQFGSLVKTTDGTFTLTSTDQTVMKFDEDHRLASNTDRNGNEVTYAYNDDGSLASVTDPVGLVTTLSYTAGRLSSVTDPAGRETFFAIDGEGNLKRITDPDGSSRTWSYDELHHMTGETDQLDRTETAFFDEAGRVTGAIRKDGSRLTIFPIDTQGLDLGADSTDPNNPVRLINAGLPQAVYIDADGQATSYRLDRAGQTESARDNEGGTGGLLRDGSNLIISSTDARGNVTDFEYDDRGNLTVSTDALSANSDSASGSLRSIYDRANFEFTRELPGFIYFESTGSPDATVTIANPNQIVFESVRLDQAALENIPFAVDGDYTAVIESTSIAPIDYRFRMLGPEDARPIEMGDTLSGAIGQQADLYRLSGAPGDRFNLRNLIAGSSVVVRGFDIYGEERFGQTNEDVADLVIPRSGEIFLLFEDQTNQPDLMEYSYTAELIQNVPPSELIGPQIHFGEIIEGNFDGVNRTENYTLSVSDFSVLYLDAISPNDRFQVRFEIEGPDGRQASSIWLDRTSDGLRLRPGEYQISLSNLNGAPFSYSFQLHNFRVLPTITPGQEVAISNLDAEAQPYELNTETPTRFYLQADVLVPSARWAAFDSSGKQVDGGNFDDQGVLELPKAGTYTLVLNSVRGLGNTGGGEPFSVKLQTVPVRPSSALALGQRTRAVAQSRGEAFQYSFELSEATNLFFEGLASDRFFWSLDGPTGRVADQVWSRTLVQGGLLDSLSGLVPGRYSLNIEPQAAEVGTFEFFLGRLKEGLLIGLDTPIDAAVDQDDFPIYRFDLSTGQEYAFEKLLGPEGSLLHWQLLDPAGNVVFDEEFKDQKLFEPTMTGTYSLVFSSYSNDIEDPAFRFQINDLGAADVVPTVDEGIPLLLDTLVRGEISDPDDHVKFSFVVEASDFYWFDSRSPAMPSWRLSGPRGTIFSNSRADQGFYLQPGRYDLFIEPQQNQQGEFAFKVTELSLARSIEFGETITSLTTATEAQSFRFEGKSGDRIYLDEIANERFAAGFWRLYDTFGRHIRGRQFGDNEAFELPLDGPYYFVVSSSVQDNSSAPYSFVIERAASTQPVKISGTDEGGTTIAYDPVFSQVTSITDELGRQTLFTIDPITGNTMSSRRVIGDVDTDPLGDDLVTSFTYTDSGQLETMTDPLGRVMSYLYNDLQQLESITAAVGTPEEATTRYEYDEAGNQSAMIDANGNRTEYEFDAMNRLRVQTEADPDGPGPLLSPVTTFDYDFAGNLTSTTDAVGSTIVYAYDDRDRMTLVTDGLDQATEYVYGPKGNLREVIDPLGNTTLNSYDSRDRLVRSVDPDGGVTRYRYDTNNNLVSLTDPVGNETRFRYDARDRMSEEIDPLGNSTFYVYDAADNLIRKTDRNERVTTYEYDDLDRLVEEVWIEADGETIANTIQYDYDKVGNLLEVSDTVSRVTYVYDSLNRVQTVDSTGISDDADSVVTYTYDTRGNITSVSDVIGGVPGALTEYEYDALNRTTTIGQEGPSTPQKLVDFVYNEIGQYNEVSRYSDFARTNLVGETDYDYDEINRLTDLDHTNASDEVLAFFDYGYDEASRITEITDVNGQSAFSYDDRSQLTGADRSATDTRVDESYAYDANGNRVSSHLHDGGYRTGPANRLLSDGTYNYEYDDEGNMIRRTAIEGGEYRIFTWDHRNRLLEVQDFTAAGTVTNEAAFVYDGINRRIARTLDVDGEGPVAAATTDFIYDRQDVVVDVIGVEMAKIRYLHGSRVDELLVLSEGTNEEFILTDHLGSIIAKQSFGSELANHTYFDAYGNGDGEETRFGFTGRETESSIGVQYNRERYYEPELGKFLNEDPISTQQGDMNRYRYVINSPQVRVDPFGTDSFMVGVSGRLSFFFGGGISAGILIPDTIDDVYRNERGSGSNVVMAGLSALGETQFVVGGEALLGAEISAGIDFRLQRDQPGIETGFDGGLVGSVMGNDVTVSGSGGSLAFGVPRLGGGYGVSFGVGGMHTSGPLNDLLGRGVDRGFPEPPLPGRKPSKIPFPGRKPC